MLYLLHNAHFLLLQFQTLGAREAVARGTGTGLEAVQSGEQTIDDEAKEHLFGRKY